ncbi:MAG: oxidoreductase [Eubacterium sp.]|nr:oxidoreductase [Eubacterium sp.]
MSEEYLDNITPDSMTGLILGFEGIRNSLVILNGPTGCKFFHSITAENQSVRKDDYDPLNWPDEWFFGQRRVPCTYLDKRDYVYGSEGKLTDAIRYILGRMTPSVIAVVNSPGAALIGDDLERIVRATVTSCGFVTDQSLDGRPGYLSDDHGCRYIKIITCQSPGWSKDVTDGYKEACRTVIDKYCGEEKNDQSGSHTVNLLGLSIYQKYHTGDIAEIKRLLSLCKVRINTALLCESTPEELEAVPEAALNVVIDPDWGCDAAEYLNGKFGTPYIRSEYGYPVGFKAMEKLIREVCDRLSADPGPAVEELEKARAKVFIHIARISSLTGLPKGARFAVFGEPSVKQGYASFLKEYLGMTETDDDPEIVLADGNTIARMKAEGRRFSGIEISLPSIGYIDVIDKTHLGAAGGLFLIEQILNSLAY